MASSLYADEPKVDTLFTVNKQNGLLTTFAEGNKILDEPTTEKDGVKNGTIIQMHTDAEGERKFYLIHNTGRSELILLSGHNNLTFMEYLGDSVFMHVICLDHKLDDGSYLYISSGTRVGVLGATTGRMFSGKAQPSAMFNFMLKDFIKKNE